MPTVVDVPTADEVWGTEAVGPGTVGRVSSEVATRDPPSTAGTFVPDGWGPAAPAAEDEGTGAVTVITVTTGRGSPADVRLTECPADPWSTGSVDRV